MDIIIIIVQTRIMVHGEVTEPLYLTHHGVQGLHLVMVGDHELNYLQISKSAVIILFRGKVILSSFRGNISVTDVWFEFKMFREILNFSIVMMALSVIFLIYSS